MLNLGFVSVKSVSSVGAVRGCGFTIRLLMTKVALPSAGTPLSVPSKWVKPSFSAIASPVPRATEVTPSVGPYEPVASPVDQVTIGLRPEEVDPYTLPLYALVTLKVQSLYPHLGTVILLQRQH